MKQPNAKKIPYKTKIHDVHRVDNYHWMRLSDKQKNAIKKDNSTQKVLDYIKNF